MKVQLRCLEDIYYERKLSFSKLFTGRAQDFLVTWLHCHPATFILHIMSSKYLKLAAKLLIMVLVKNDFCLGHFSFYF